MKLQNVEQMALHVLDVVNNSKDETRHDSVTSSSSSLAMDGVPVRVRHSDVFKWLERIAAGKRPGIGTALPQGFRMKETDDGFDFEIVLPRPDPWHQKPVTLIRSPMGSLPFFQAVILLIWNDRTLRERLRCCTNCKRYYFQKSKKRNPKGHYFCTTIEPTSTCRQDFCDIERGKKKAPDTPRSR